MAELNSPFPSASRPGPSGEPAVLSQLRGAPHPFGARSYRAAGIFAGLAVAAIGVDAPMANVFRLATWEPLIKLLILSEVFAHGLGVLLILIAAACLDRQLTRRQLGFLTACPLLAGGAANLAKLLVARHRPSYFHHPNAPEELVASFAGWFPCLTGEFGKAIQSFPSAHTATATGLALGLAWRYPRGRWLFAVLASLATLQRLVTDAHFLSDTLAGAAIGLLVASLLLDPRVQLWGAELRWRMARGLTAALQAARQWGSRPAAELRPLSLRLRAALSGLSGLSGLREVRRGLPPTSGEPRRSPAPPEHGVAGST